jgi:hypothetical protein
MKTQSEAGQKGQLTTDSQKRLVAYTTAAGLGALFTSYNVDGQVTASAAFAPYPATLPASSSTNTVDFPFDIDGDGTNDFQVVLFGEGMVPLHSQVADIMGLTNSVGTTNTVINDSMTSYLHAWMGGETISSATGIAPSYKPRLAIAYGNGTYLNNKFPETAAVGFSFVSGLDGQTHFGYMDLHVNGSTNDLGQKIITSVTIKDVYYNATANAGITVPESVIVTNLSLGAGNQVTINFTSNTNTPPASFKLETSPVLGPSASWVTDNSAVFTQSLIANPNGAKPLAHYQAVTTGNGAPAQFFRISH